jgi:hypothetical protein
MAGTRAMGGAALEHSAPREANDFYATPAPTTRALLRVEQFEGAIWECACGDGAISRVLQDAGYEVVSTDLIDRGFGEGCRDFLMEPELLAPNVVTNPPFSEADDFTLRALSLGAEKVAILQRIAWLEGAARHQRLWARHPPARVWQFAKRQTLWRGGDPNAQDKGGTIAFAWFVWDVSHRGAPQLGWLI